MQSFFKTSNYESHKNENPKRLPETCQWFLHHLTFEKWRSGHFDNVLWLSADPGYGKSVLSRALIDETLVANSEDPVTICYFFFKDNREQSSATTAIFALIHQLITQHQRIIWDLFGRSPGGINGLRSDFEAVWNLFIRAAISIGNVVCVLDAVDKCKSTERESLVKRLESFHASKRASGRLEHKLKFFTTSRIFTKDEPTLLSLVQSIPNIRLAGEDGSKKVSSEIDIVLGLELQTIAENFGLDKNAYSTLNERLKQTLNKTYLWLRLVLAVVRFSLAQDEW